MMDIVRQRHSAISRRVLLAVPLSCLLRARASDAGVLAAQLRRVQIAAIDRVHDLTPPLTLGIAKVVLRPGAIAAAAIPRGARMIVVESGVLAVSVMSAFDAPLTASEFSLRAATPVDGDELFVPAGAAITFAARGVSAIRNPGGKSVVALDIVIYREEPRPMARAFTTEDGVSFQLLASASATEAPAGRAAVTLERLRLGEQSQLPPELSTGLMLLRVEAGSVQLLPTAGEVFAARPAASTPYSMPGSLEPIPAAAPREVTAGGVVFLPVGSAAAVANPSQRSAELLSLMVREMV